jgi:hypothetical protein
MTRKIISGLIQASNPINDESKSVAEIQAFTSPRAASPPSTPRVVSMSVNASTSPRSSGVPCRSASFPPRAASEPPPASGNP